MISKPLSPLHDQLIPDYITKIIEQQRRFQKQTESVLRPFQNDLLDIQRRFSEVAQVAEKYQQMFDDSERWAETLAIVQEKLPKRGWYLTGQEPCRLTPHLARLIKDEKWEEVDKTLVDHAVDLAVDANAFTTWLQQHSVPDCCIERVRIFLDARANGQHDIATLVGIPTIGEVSRALYEGTLVRTTSMSW